MAKKGKLAIALAIIVMGSGAIKSTAEPPSSRCLLAANLRCYCQYLYFRSWQAGGCNLTGTEMKNHVVKLIDKAGMQEKSQDDFADKVVSVLEPVCCTYWRGFDRSKQDEMLEFYLEEIDKLVDAYYSG